MTLLIVIEASILKGNISRTVAARVLVLSRVFALGVSLLNELSVNNIAFHWLTSSRCLGGADGRI